MSPDVRGAENRVDQGVRDHIAVGMAGEPARAVDPDAAEDERDTVLERVRIDAEPDPHLGVARAHPSGSWRGSRLSKTVTVS